ncbi:MAG TPA: ABC transporter permease, partial [Roseiflexaceae bacterium]|nr:ABC transporter permease [Roseiflexaceae bacterium]
EHITAIANQVRDKIERAGHTVSFVQIPTPPGRHWADEILQALMLIMSVLGVISLLMSGFLVINTIGALLTEHTRQIGVMKSIGAGNGAIVGLYLTMVFIFGVLSLIVALPLGALGAQLFVNVFAGLLNFDSTGSGFPPYVVGLEVAAGLLVPLLAALWPVLSGTRITVREAISSYGVGKGRYGTSRIDRLMGRIRGLSRPLLLSLRNTLRRRGRLALTLSTLTLGGTMIISVLSVRESLTRTLDDFFAIYNYDIMVFTERPYRITPMEAEARAIPGVVDVEGWSQPSGRRVLADGTKTEAINITALPADTKLFQPKISAGRWLLPDDENAIVIAADLLKTEPDLKVGDELILDINGREMPWRIVGIAQVLFVNRTIYANYDYVARATNNVGQSSFVVVVTQQHDGAFQSEVAKQLRERFKRASINVSGTQTIGDIRTSNEFSFSIIVIMLLVMAVLLAVVGGLGLMGTMSINVLERTREIGVMRAIGASSAAILRIVMVEGVLIGVVSWLIGVAIALPFSKLLDEAVGQAFLKASPSYVFSTTGALLWLGVVIVLAAVSSALPAWNASRITVRDVLAYE